MVWCWLCFAGASADAGAGESQLKVFKQVIETWRHRGWGNPNWVPLTCGGREVRGTAFLSCLGGVTTSHLLPWTRKALLRSGSYSLRAPSLRPPPPPGGGRQRAHPKWGHAPRANPHWGHPDRGPPHWDPLCHVFLTQRHRFVF